MLGFVNYSFILDLKDLPNEIWKDISDYDGIYQCSNYGRIKSLKREYVRVINGKVITGYMVEKIRKPTVINVKGTNTSALYISLQVNGKNNRKTDTLSQWVGITFIGEKKKGFYFQHINKNALDNRLKNIEQVPIGKSRSNDFTKNKRVVNNFHTLPKKKHTIIRSDGQEFTFSKIVSTYGKAAYINILKGNNVRGFKWNITTKER